MLVVDDEVAITDLLVLPDIDGFDVLSRLRSTGNNIPVLFLTAKDTLQDRIKVR